MELFEEEDITIFPWLANSPDLNFIEHVWAYMKRRLDRNTEPPERLKDLWERAQEIWTDLPDDFLQKLYERMPKRLEEVIKNKEVTQCTGQPAE
ncbi:MAG: transposable element Tc1 transposase [Podila humilis]|nr:MAG: transposable element Tc1 transposase [Podila humilis]